jgi:hypothetical protein
MANPTMEVRSDNPTSVGGAAKVDLKFRVGRDPRVGC